MVCLSTFYSLAEHRRALSGLDRHELEGARVRSRLLWTEQCETSPKLFTNFGRQRAHDGFVYRLGDESGTSHSSIPSYSRHKHSASCGSKRSDPLTAPILHYIVYSCFLYITLSISYTYCFRCTDLTLSSTCYCRSSRHILARS